MRYLAIALVLVVAPAFGQQSDPASGVLVPVAPKAFHQAIRNMLQSNAALGTIAGRAIAAQPQRASKVCAIPLLDVPVRDHIDDGAVLKDGSAPVDGGIFLSPPAPECR